MSQAKQILQMLKRRKGITAAEVYEATGCMRLAARVHELRNAGYNIATELVQQESGIGAPYARYRLKR